MSFSNYLSIIIYLLFYKTLFKIYSINYDGNLWIFIS